MKAVFAKSPPFSPAFNTEAQAVPSGYGKYHVPLQLMNGEVESSLMFQVCHRRWLILIW